MLFAERLRLLPALAGSKPVNDPVTVKLLCDSVRRVEKIVKMLKSTLDGSGGIL